MAQLNPKTLQLRQLFANKFEESSFPAFEAYTNGINKTPEETLYNEFKLIEILVKSECQRDNLQTFLAIALEDRFSDDPDQLASNALLFPHILFKIFMEPPLEYLNQIFDTATASISKSIRLNLSAKQLLSELRFDISQITISYTLKEMIKLQYFESVESYCINFSQSEYLRSDWKSHESTRKSFFHSQAHQSFHKLLNLLTERIQDTELTTFLLSASPHTTLLHSDEVNGLLIPVRIFPAPLISFARMTLNPGSRTVYQTETTESINHYDDISFSLFMEEINKIDELNFDPNHITTHFQIDILRATVNSPQYYHSITDKTTSLTNNDNDSLNSVSSARNTENESSHSGSIIQHFDTPNTNQSPQTSPPEYEDTTRPISDNIDTIKLYVNYLTDAYPIAQSSHIRRQLSHEIANFNLPNHWNQIPVSLDHLVELNSLDARYQNSQVTLTVHIYNTVKQFHITRNQSNTAMFFTEIEAIDRIDNLVCYL